MRRARMRGEMYIFVRFAGSMHFEGPIRAVEAMATLFSPKRVNGISLMPVCWPVRVQAVWPWRARKRRGGVGIVDSIVSIMW